MYYHTSLPWLTIDRLRSGRDIRLSTATMRALNSRRPQLTSTFYLFPRSFLCPLLLLFLLHDARARSVHREEDDTATKLPSIKSTDGIREITLGNDAAEKVQGEFAGSRDHGAEKGRTVPEGSENVKEKLPQLVVDGRSDDREDAPVSNKGSGITKGEPKKIDAAEVSEVLKQEDEEASVAKKRRRNDVALVGKSELREDEVGGEGIRRFDARVDPQGVASGEIEVPLEKRNYKGSPKSIESAEESGVREADESREKIPDYFRKSGKIENDRSKSDEESASNENSGSPESDEYQANRDYRSFAEVEEKMRRKSSTVYLNAEEKNISDGEQQSIVDGQIRKLISIRDDALDGQKSDEIDEAQLLNTKKEVGMDEVTFTQDEIQGQRISKVKDTQLTDSERSIGGGGLLRAWKNQAISLQEQIRDRTFLLRLKEQTPEVLPDIPKFTESQLLDALERIVLLRRLEPLSESYASNIRELDLTDEQLRIIKCAEQLVAARERQSFIASLTECIRGLSILNCMRIFVWPIVVENLPVSISQSLGNLPIEVNVFDLFQGNRQKSGRAQDLHRIRLLIPESVVYNILQDALETSPSDETLISYIDPKNETLTKLLSADQMNILQMAEKFLPQVLRQDYSDKMFSCVRRFEYFSCVKYFAWPLIKQYFPALPAFPDYQTWYPVIDLSPQYPIFPFPIFSEDGGELPEVVDADATRTKKPRPEAIIIQVLQDTLKEQPRISTTPSFLDHTMDTYVTLMPEDQLLTINMAEQLIPTSRRPEFIERTVRCMKEYNYLTCFKYSTWPTVKHYIPTLPDISNLLPDFLAPELPEISSYVSGISTYPSYYWPVYGGEFQKETIAPEYIAKNRANAVQAGDELEVEILEILQAARSLADTSMELPQRILTAYPNPINIATFTSRQIKILQLAESLVPDTARSTFDAEIVAYLERANSFTDCARYVIWPTIAKYVPSLAAFPRQTADPGNAQTSLGTKESAINPGEMIQERISSAVEQEKVAEVLLPDKESRNRVLNLPAISVSGIRFVPIFTDYPEAVILNILRSLQLNSFKTNTGTAPFATKNQQFIDLLNDQQANIVSIVDTLLPESIRPEFANKMIECLRIKNFLICTREIIWPLLSQYFPWLPNFPNFTFLSDGSPNNSSSTSNQTLTESSTASDSSPLSETNVKTGQHGDTTVTITDTRFLPIFNELPETIILNILKAVELSIPVLPEPPASARTQEFSALLTEQQINILRIAENLLPAASRSEFINEMGACIKQKSFLECTGDKAWPTIAEFYPWLPSFPNFGTLRNLPQVPGTDSVKFQVFLSEKPSLPNADSLAPRDSSNRNAAALSREVEMKMESILLEVLSETPELDRSYLNVADPVASLLTGQQLSIVRLIERGLPGAARSSYIDKMLRCVTRYNFIACTNSTGWPILKESVPLLPNFSIFTDLLSQLPGIAQIPGDGQIPALPDLGSIVNNIPGLSQLPTELPQLPLDFGGLAGKKYQTSQLDSRPDAQATKTNGTPSLTPSVGIDGIVPGYAGQPPGILVNLQSDKILLPLNVPLPAQAVDAKSVPDIKTRKRRSSMDTLESYYDTEQATDDSASSSQTYPNITESEYLRLLIRVKEIARFSAAAGSSKTKQYLADTLNSTIRKSLTADQYEILKIVQDLDDQPSPKGIASQVVQCITSLSFIRCLGIFVWPLITNNLPSIIGLPSFPSFGIFGRSANTESQVQEFFGMSTDDFEKELLARKESIEGYLLDWYRKLVEDEFQMDMGFVKIKGYGNNELGISFSGFREGRGAKLKDNKNLPSILTIISDIMEEVLDQRPEGEKTKREKEKKERSIDDSRETDIQFLKDTEEYVDIRRSMDDDEIITMILNKIKANDSELAKDDAKHFGSDDAYNAFEVLFGTKLNDKLAEKDETLDHQLKSLEVEPIDPSKEVDIVSLESQTSTDELGASPLRGQVSYNLDRETNRNQEERRREKRARNVFLQSRSENRSDKHLKDSVMESFETVEDNKIIEDRPEKDTRSSVIVQLPRLHDDVIPRKVTNSLAHLSRAFGSKMTQMMPGFGFILSFLLQMGLAHARAAASMAGMISNMALGSAMIGMLRDSMFGSSNHPQIKYVYDNHKTGPGISWPTRYQSGSHYYG